MKTITSNLITANLFAANGQQYAAVAAAVVTRAVGGVATREGQAALRSYITDQLIPQFYDAKTEAEQGSWLFTSGQKVTVQKVVNAKDNAVRALRTACTDAGYVLGINIRKGKVTISKVKPAAPLDPIDDKGIQGTSAETDGEQTAEENGSATALPDRLERILGNCKDLDDSSLLYLIGRLTDKLSADAFGEATRRTVKNLETVDLQDLDKQQRAFSAAYVAAVNAERVTATQQ